MGNRHPEDGAPREREARGARRAGGAPRALPPKLSDGWGGLRSRGWKHHGGVSAGFDRDDPMTTPVFTWETPCSIVSLAVASHRGFSRALSGFHKLPLTSLNTVLHAWLLTSPVVRCFFGRGEVASLEPKLQTWESPRQDAEGGRGDRTCSREKAAPATPFSRSAPCHFLPETSPSFCWGFLNILHGHQRVAPWVFLPSLSHVPVKGEAG